MPNNVGDPNLLVFGNSLYAKEWIGINPNNITSPIKSTVQIRTTPVVNGLSTVANVLLTDPFGGHNSNILENSRYSYQTEVSRIKQKVSLQPNTQYTLSLYQYDADGNISSEQLYPYNGNIQFSWNDGVSTHDIDVTTQHSSGVVVANNAPATNSPVWLRQYVTFTTGASCDPVNSWVGVRSKFRKATQFGYGVYDGYTQAITDKNAIGYIPSYIWGDVIIYGVQLVAGNTVQPYVPSTISVPLNLLTNGDELTNTSWIPDLELTSGWNSSRADPLGGVSTNTLTVINNTSGAIKQMVPLQKPNYLSMSSMAINSIYTLSVYQWVGTNTTNVPNNGSLKLQWHDGVAESDNNIYSTTIVDGPSFGTTGTPIGWVRRSWTFDSANTKTAYFGSILNSDKVWIKLFNTGGLNTNIILYGAQLVEGSVAVPYIPTNGIVRTVIKPIGSINLSRQYYSPWRLSGIGLIAGTGKWSLSLGGNYLNKGNSFDARYLDKTTKLWLKYWQYDDSAAKWIPNIEVSPTGELTADRLQILNPYGTSFYQDIFNLTPGVTYCTSIYIKTPTNGTVNVLTGNIINTPFTISMKAYSSTGSPPDYSTVSIPTTPAYHNSVGSWVRYSQLFVAPQAKGVRVSISHSGIQSSMYYGAQVVEGINPTTYISDLSIDLVPVSFSLAAQQFPCWRLSGPGIITDCSPTPNGVFYINDNNNWEALSITTDIVFNAVNGINNFTRIASIRKFYTNAALPLNPLLTVSTDKAIITYNTLGIVDTNQLITITPALTDLPTSSVVVFTVTAYDSFDVSLGKINLSSVGLNIRTMTGEQFDTYPNTEYVKITAYFYVNGDRTDYIKIYKLQTESNKIIAFLEKENYSVRSHYTGDFPELDIKSTFKIYNGTTDVTNTYAFSITNIPKVGVKGHWPLVKGTNYFVPSNSFTATYWDVRSQRWLYYWGNESISNMVIYPNTTIDPVYSRYDGDTAVLQRQNGNAFFYTVNKNLIPGVTYTFSIYMKVSDNNVGGNPSIRIVGEDVNNGQLLGQFYWSQLNKLTWRRVSFTLIPTVSASTYGIRFACQMACDKGQSIDLYGAQLIEGGVPITYVPDNLPVPLRIISSDFRIGCAKLTNVSITSGPLQLVMASVIPKHEQPLHPLLGMNQPGPPGYGGNYFPRNNIIKSARLGARILTRDVSTGWDPNISNVGQGVAWVVHAPGEHGTNVNLNAADGDGDWSHVTLDSDGYITTMTPGYTAYALFFIEVGPFYVYSPLQWYPIADYVFTWDGDGDWDFNGLEISGNPIEQIVSRAPGRIVMRINDTKITTGIGFSLTRVNPLDYPRNFKLGLLDRESTVDEWAPEYMNFMKQFSCIRYMQWTGANATPEVFWHERRLPSHMGCRYMSWEEVIDFANKSKRDLWVNIPGMVDDDYVIKMATLFRDTVDPTLTIYVEYTNEWWNPGFSQNWWLGYYGIKNGFGDPNASFNSAGWTACIEYCTYRSVKVFEIWKSIFSGPRGKIQPIQNNKLAKSRIQCIMPSARPGDSSEVINQIFGYALKYSKNKDTIPYDIGCGSAYYASEFNPNQADQTKNVQLVEDWLNLSKGAIDGTNISGLHATINSAKTKYPNNELASWTIYEGANDYTDKWNKMETACSAADHPRMAELVRYSLQNHFDNFNSLYMYFESITVSGIWECYGVLLRLPYKSSDNSWLTSSKYLGMLQLKGVNKQSIPTLSFTPSARVEYITSDNGVMKVNTDVIGNTIVTPIISSTIVTPSIVEIPVQHSTSSRIVGKKVGKLYGLVTTRGTLTTDEHLAIITNIKLKP